MQDTHELDGLAMTESGATVALAASTPYLRALERYGDGVDHRRRALRALLPRYGLSEQVLEVEHARLPHDLSLESMRYYTAALGDPAFVLHALSLWQLGDQGIGDYLNASCDNLGQLLRTVGEYLALLHDGLHFTTRSDGDRTFLHCDFEHGVTPHRYFVEGALGKVVLEVRRALGPAADAAIRGLHFAHPAPSYRAAYRNVLAIEPEFGQGHDALVFASSALSMPFRSADPVLHAILRKQATRMLRERPARSLLDQVRGLVNEELPHNGADQGVVAQRLGMSTATLRRRLERRHGLRYVDVVDELRRDIAARELARTEAAIDEVGRRVGFAQTAAFYRAFRRWFGCTPAEYRRATGGGYRRQPQ